MLRYDMPINMGATIIDVSVLKELFCETNVFYSTPYLALLFSKLDYSLHHILDKECFEINVFYSAPYRALLFSLLGYSLRHILDNTNYEITVFY